MEKSYKTKFLINTNTNASTPTAINYRCQYCGKNKSDSIESVNFLGLYLKQKLRSIYIPKGNKTNSPYIVYDNCYTDTLFRVSVPYCSTSKNMEIQSFSVEYLCRCGNLKFEVNYRMDDFDIPQHIKQSRSSIIIVNKNGKNIGKLRQ